VAVLRALVQRQQPLPDPALEAVKTWRYLRLGMIVLVVGLAAAVLHEHLRVPGQCWQRSLSAYYYTPVRGLLVATLGGLSVCLIAVKGSTDWEDVLLNLAGACAPVVAFVPITDPGTCGAVPSTAAERDLAVANNVVGMLVTGGVALLLLAGLTVARAWDPRRQRPSTTALAGFAVTVVLYVLTALVFALDRPWFTAHGHTVAAVAMFAFFYANVWLNAANLRLAGRARTARAPALNSYAVIGSLMTVVVVASVLLALVAHWPYWKLGLETGLIVLFAAFWALQTAELWNQGLRSPSPPSPREV
jgi:hypothetical protein